MQKYYKKTLKLAYLIQSIACSNSLAFIFCNSFYHLGLQLSLHLKHNYIKQTLDVNFGGVCQLKTH